MQTLSLQNLQISYFYPWDEQGTMTFQGRMWNLHQRLYQGLDKQQLMPYSQLGILFLNEDLTLKYPDPPCIGNLKKI